MVHFVTPLVMVSICRACRFDDEERSSLRGASISPAFHASGGWSSENPERPLRRSP